MVSKKRINPTTVNRDNDQLMHMLGSFVLIWSTFESIIDAAIVKRLGITRIKGAIVVSDLGILARVGILKSLLNLQTDKQQAALTTIDKIQEEAKRNTLMHATIHLSGGTLEFIKLETKTRLKAKLIEYDPEEFAKRINKISDLIDDLRDQLGVSERDRMSISKMGRESMGSD